MLELEKLFKKLDIDEDGFIDKISFKRIVNILELPIYPDKITDQSSLDDLVTYIQSVPEDKRHLIRLSDLKEKLSQKIDSRSVDFLLKEYCGRNYSGIRLDLTKIVEKIEQDDSLTSI